MLSGTWTQLPNPNYAPPAGPYARQWTEMAWDSVRQEIVIWGGNSAGGYNGYLNDIWSLNTGTSLWTQLDPNVNCPGNSGFTKPNGSDDSNFKYDPVNNIYWLFGANSGYRCFSIVPVSIAGAGSTPTTLTDPNLASSDSGAYLNWRVRIGTTDVGVTAYDGPSKTLTLSAPVAGLAAGTNYQIYATFTAGIWYFDPATNKWTGQNTPAGNTGITPAPGRVAAAVAYSDTDKAFALFDGLLSGTVDKTVWRLDVQTKLWTQNPLPATTPPHMREMLNSFVYDRQNNVFILFGGVCAECPGTTYGGQTWAYYLATNTWVNMNPPTAPSARAQQVMAYDDVNGVITLFGGVNASGPLGDTWYYHVPSNTWTQVAPPASPPPRYLGEVAYDPVHQQTVVFSGVCPTSPCADIWGLKLTPAVGAPTVSMSAPASGSIYAAPATINLVANASDADGSIAKVEFFSGSTKLGETSTAPYSLSWTNVAAGSYSVTARATDNAGNVTTSAAISVTVNGPTNQLPTVSLSAPTAGSGYVAPAMITLTANANDPDGSIAKVEFFVGSTKIGESSTAPYSMNWTNVAAGSYSITARATDNQGGTATSGAVSISVTGAVNQPPLVSLSSPLNGSTYVSPATITLSANASDPDGSIAKVEFFNGGTKIGESST
ncbi:MAG TPA: Ig-like domain-containing protein, partial [Burkholderiaceae bacterium]